MLILCMTYVCNVISYIQLNALLFTVLLQISVNGIDILTNNSDRPFLTQRL